MPGGARHLQQLSVVWPKEQSARQSSAAHLLPHLQQSLLEKSCAQSAKGQQRSSLVESRN